MAAPTWPSVRRTAARVLVVVGALACHDALFIPLHQRLGEPAFLVALVPCVLAGVLLGPWGALGAVLATIWIDRAHAIALGLAPGPELVAAILAKVLFGVGTGVVVSHSRRVQSLNLELEAEIRERKRTEAQLAHNERLHRALVESLGEGVGLFDVERRFMFANEALARMLHATTAELVGRKLDDFLDEASRARVAAPPSDAVARSYELGLEDQLERLLLVTETRWSESSSDAGHSLLVLRDLTDRVQTERRQRDLELELQRSQSLQSLAVLAGGVAHDFNNLLSGVVGNVEFALLKVPADASPKLTECLEEIKAFAKEATELSRQMLAYAGRRSLTAVPMDVNAEVREVLRLSRSTVEARARLEVELAESIPSVRADRFQFRQVLINLVLNAAEAMGGERGTIRVRTRCVELEEARLERLGAPAATPPGPYVEVLVQDTGEGIPESARKQIFEPYFSTKAQGRGMGLAAAAGIVHTHRGWLSVESETGRGTRFGVWLPASGEAPERSSEPPASGIVAIPGRCVLLIDDEPAVRIVTRRLLSEMGQEVITADSGSSGISVFQRHHADIDLVLLDLTMPGLSGAEVLRELVAIDPSVEIVITSGFEPTDAGNLLSMPNVLGFLTKPHALAELEAMLGWCRKRPSARLRSSCGQA